MANRDLSNFRSVIGQVVEEPNSALSATAEFAENLVRQGEEAKILEKSSQAQLDLAILENQYKIDYEGNPLGGIKKFKEDRQKLYKEVGKGISPLYSRVWREKTGKLDTLSDANQQAWALKQTRVNSVNSLNNNMQNTFSQASNDGVAFGNSSDSEIKAFTNFATSLDNLKQFGDRNIGAETTAKVLDNYQEDYMKSFLSGVSVSNPLKAMRLMESEEVKNSFKDVNQYMKMESAIASRVKRFNKVNKSKEVVGRLTAENSLIPRIGKMNIAELEQSFSKFGMSPAVQAFYKDVNGYSNTKRALTQNEKTEGKSKLYSTLSQFIQKDETTDGDMSALQDSVYVGMSKSILSKAEGFGLLNELMLPVIEKKRGELEKFEINEFLPFRENLGFNQLEEVIDTMSGLSVSGDTPTSEENFIQDSARNDMYDYYLSFLKKEASTRDIPVANISDLDYSEQKDIYEKAINSAKQNFNFKHYPNIKSDVNAFVKPAPIRISGDADYNKLESGVEFIAPDGSTRTKP